MPRERTHECKHNWKETRVDYVPNGRNSRVEYRKECSLCFEEKYHYWVEFNLDTSTAHRSLSIPEDWQVLADREFEEAGNIAEKIQEMITEMKEKLANG